MPDPDERRWEALQEVGSLVQNFGRKVSSFENFGPDDTFCMEISIVNISEEIGKGRNGTTVFKGFHRGNPVALKRFPTDHVIVDDEILHRLSARPHPNVVLNHGLTYCRDSGYLILELCDFSLRDLISARASSDLTVNDVDSPSVVDHKQKQSSLKNRLLNIHLWTADGDPSQTLVKLMRHVLLGVHHLHGCQIVHGDLRPENVLIVDSKDPRAKVSDVRVSKCLCGHQSSLVKPASGWQAPELFNPDKSPTSESDMFSVGCLLFYCVTQGSHLFGDFPECDMNIKNFTMKNFPATFSREASHLMYGLLNRVPTARPTAAVALVHPFFWSPEKRMTFFCDLSDKAQWCMTYDPASPLPFELDRKGGLIFGTVWRSCLDPVLQRDLLNVHYDYRKVTDLLRMLRNKWVRRSEHLPAIQALFYPFPDGQEKYFSKKFPNLLLETYFLALKFCKNDPTFKKYLEIGEC